MAEKTPLDKVLLNVDRLDRIVKYAKSIGASDELAEVFATSKASARLQWDGVALTLDGVNVVDDAATKEHFTKGPLSPLFSAANVTNKNAPTIDPALVELARTNLTSRGALYRLLGSAEAVDAVLAGNAGDTPGSISVVDDTTKTAPKLKDGKTNPWSAEGWDSLKQQSIVRSLGPAKASEIARSAGSFLGATSPRSKNMTSNRRSA